MKLANEIYEQIKYWLPWFAGAGILLKIVQPTVKWFRDLKENHLVHIQAGVENLDTTLQTQTTSIVSELKELRQDIRSLHRGGC